MKGILIVWIILASISGWGQEETLQSDSITLISWNVFLRPSILGDEQMKRVDSIATYLDSSGADVLVLQEVFHKKARRRLIKRLNKKYPHHTAKGPVSFWGVPSGVMIFSTNKIEREERVSFKKATGSDKLARKGAICASISFFEQKFHIIGTHLQAGGGKEGSMIRKHQVRRLRKLSEKKDSADVVIYAGDFNINRESKYYVDLVDSLSCETINPESLVQVTSNLGDHELTKTSGSSKWIDFIFIRKKSKAKITKSWIEEPKAKRRNQKRRLSDHNPIFSTIKIRTKDKSK